MKRLALYFDDMWNKLSVNNPTNVVLTATSIERQNADRISQIIHCGEEVGASRREQILRLPAREVAN